MSEYDLDDTAMDLDRALRALVFATECTLATVEHLETLKRPSKTELSRQRSIAKKLLAELRCLGVTDPLDINERSVGRVKDLL